MAAETSQRRYGPAEVREILRRAQSPERPAHDDGPGLTESELLETARDVGFTEGQVQAALVRYEGDQELARVQGEVQQLQRRAVATHATWFVVANGVFAGLNLSLGPPLLFWIPLVLWGLVFLLHLRGVFFPDPDRLRELAQQRQTKQRLKESTRQLGHALGRGAADLMSAAARRLEKR